MKLQERIEAFEEHDAEIWVISPDPADKLEAMRAKRGLTFPTLMDPDLSVARNYGVLNEKSPKVPHPTALVINKAGELIYVRVDEDYAQRPSTEELLDALRTAVSTAETSSR